MNAALHSHPSREQLTAFVSGKMAEREASELEGHLAGCDACRTVLEALPEDTLVSLLRAADTQPDAPTEPFNGQGPSPLPAAGDTATPPAALRDHPRYRILDLVGVGGMGAVYRAEHRLMERLIALKVINSRLLDRPGMVERFRREIRVAARLTHPNIVTAHDAEQAGDVHFLVMEYVEGTSLDRRLKEQGPLPVAEACAYVRQAALGLQHAFEQGLVHRDIKPANLMVTPQGQVKILDFGLAHLVSETAAGAGLTELGTIMGTPDYLAPEQIRDARSADIRADIYSLGCTLFTLLAGKPPFPEGNYAQTLAAHLEQTPRPLKELRPDVPPELDRVLARMLAKHPAHRYQTPAQVAEALAPFAGGRVPRRPRHWPWLAALVLVGLLGIGAVLFGPAIFRIATNQGQLVIETDDPDIEVVVKQNGRLVKILDAHSKHEVTLRAGAYELELTPGKDGLKLSTREFTLERGGKKIVQVRLEQLPPAQQRASDSSVPKPSPSPGENPKHPQISPEPLPEMPAGSALSPTALVQRPAALPGVRSWTLETVAHRSYIWALARSPDGRLLASAGHDSIRVWNTQSGRLVRVLTFAQTGASVIITDLAWSPDGNYLAATRGGEGVVQVWDMASGRLLRTLRSSNAVVSVAWSPDGQRLAVGGEGGAVHLWGSHSGRLQATLSDHAGPVWLVAWSPDGKLLASAGIKDRALHLWDPDSGQLLRRLEAEPGDFRAGAWSPDGRLLATAGAAGKVHFWALSSGKVLRTRHAGAGVHLNCLAWSPDGKTVAAAGTTDNRVHLWEAASGKPFGTLRGHTHQIMKLCWLPDSTTLASASWDRTVRLWNVQTEETVMTLPALPGITALAWAGDGTLACAAHQAALPLWSPATGKLVRALKTREAEVGAVAWSPDSKKLAYSGRWPSKNVWTWEARTDRTALVDDEGGSALAWSPQGKGLAVAGWNNQVLLHELPHGEKYQTPLGHRGTINALAYSSNGKTLATGSWDRRIALWTVDSHEPPRTLEGHSVGVVALAWSPEDNLLASGGWDEQTLSDGIHLWDPSSGKRLRTLTLADKVRALAWQPHGKMLASSGSPEHTVRLWSPAAGQVLRSLSGHALYVTAIAWSPDGKTIAAGGEDGAVGFWDPDTGRLRGWCLVLGPDHYLALSADGHSRASSPLGRAVVYVVQTAQGQETLSAEEFARKYGWKNDSEEVRLMEPLP